MPLGGWKEGKTKHTEDYGKRKEKERGSSLLPSSLHAPFFTGGSLCRGERVNASEFVYHCFDSYMTLETSF